MEKEIIRVIIAEDMEPIRKRYKKILSDVEDIEVIADVATGKEVVEVAQKMDPDVILMDIEMERKDAGLRAAKQLLEEYCDLKIIILTVYEQDELIYTAFQLGVCDYILKNAKAEEVITSVRNVFWGKAALRPELATKILGEFKRVKDYESSFLYAVNIVSSLTSTEMETLKLLLDGKTRREICAIRFVEISTVKTQIRNILQKFNRKTTDEVMELIHGMHLKEFISQQVEKM